MRNYITQLREDLRDPGMLGWQILLAGALGMSILGSTNKVIFHFVTGS